ncbi:CUE domain-containing protein 2-like isoform X2 [Antedon mediterranea]|uniref:CUE domain-containing protein 2-like isoform X2 n=1 Tax=Antedon mediterranea TaxID=105859 RepID=UPI003AF685D5
MASENFNIEDKLVIFAKKHFIYNSLSSVDEIVLDYVSSILEDIGSEDDFAVDDFIEMMDAYITGFKNIEREEVCKWIFHVAEQFKSKDQEEVNTPQISSETPELFILPSCDATDDRKNSKLNDTEIVSEEVDEKHSSIEENMRLLLEMFPASCQLEVKHCLSMAEGEVEKAAQLMLLRQDTGESEKLKQQMTTSTRYKTHSENYETKLKENILQKYSYVDTDDDKIDHRPLVQKEVCIMSKGLSTLSN